MGNRSTVGGGGSAGRIVIRRRLQLSVAFFNKRDDLFEFAILYEIVSESQSLDFIHIQYVDRCPTTWCTAHDHCTDKTEVFVPILSPWIEQLDNFTCLGIDSGKIRRFSKIASNTCKRKVVEFVVAVMLSRNYVLNMMSPKPVVLLMELAVFTPILSTLPHDLTNGFVHHSVSFRSVLLATA